MKDDLPLEWFPSSRTKGSGTASGNSRRSSGPSSRLFRGVSSSPCTRSFHAFTSWVAWRHAPSGRTLSTLAEPTSQPGSAVESRRPATAATAGIVTPRAARDGHTARRFI
eukprot:scaffold120694_cov35-Tisochrysis_lutea.AAC.1